MRITAEKAGRKVLYIAAGAALMVWLLLFGGIVSHAAEVTATTNAKVRSQASTDSDVVGSVSSGTTMSTSGETTGADGKVWYQVTVGGQTGYIRSDLVSTSAGMTQEEVERENSYTETSATVSDTDVKSVTVTESSVNVRKGPSSTDAKVTSAKAGAVLEVTGEAVGADGKTWYQVNVDGKSGFIRADLVEPADTSEGEGSEEEMPDGEDMAEGSEEAPAEPETTTEISNVISSRVIPGDVNLEDMTVDEATLEEWASGNYYVLYTKDADGGDSWYLYSLSDGQFEEIKNLHAEDGESGEGPSLSSLFKGSSRIIMLIVIALFVILILVCILLAVKLHEYREYGYEEDDEDEDDDDEEDDEDEDEDDDEDDEDEDDDEDDEDEDDEDERPVKKRRWSPKNFLARHEDDDDDDEDDEDEEDDDDENDEEEEYLDDDDFEFEFLNMDDKDSFK